MEILLLDKGTDYNSLMRRYDINRNCCISKGSTDIEMVYLRGKNIPFFLYVYNGWESVYIRHVDGIGIEAGELSHKSSFISLSDLGMQVEPTDRFDVYTGMEVFRLKEDEIRYDKDLIDFVKHDKDKTLNLYIEEITKGDRFIIDHITYEADEYSWDNDCSYEKLQVESKMPWNTAK